MIDAALRAFRTRPAATVGVPLLGIAVAAALPLMIHFASQGAPPGALRVVHPKGGLPQLEDSQGRAVLLRGVAVTGLIQYAPDYRENPPVTDGDLTEIAALGFNFIRLPVSWSRIQPRPGSTDTRYLARVAAVASDATRHGLWVLIDMHFDRYNQRLAPGNEADGAPNWATLAPASCPAQPGPDDCARAAWQSFWDDRTIAGVGLQERYIEAVLALSRKLRSQPGIAGFELMNNPSSGGAPTASFERGELWPFWRRAITALRRDGERRPLWIDRPASAEQTDILPSQSLGVPLTDPNLVYAPHDYVGVFSPPSWPAGGVQRVQHWYLAAARAATSLRMALVIGEWGSQAGGAWDRLLAAKLAIQNGASLGSAFWMWKQRPGFYNWQVVNLDGALRGDSTRAQLLSRPHADAIPGRLISSASNTTHLTIRLRGPGGTAALWSGTGISDRTTRAGTWLTHAALDGRPVSASRQQRSFRSGAVSLLGYVVTVRVPPGEHVLTLS